MCKPSQTISDTKLDTHVSRTTMSFRFESTILRGNMQSYKVDEIERFPVSFESDLNHMLQKMPVSTHVHHRNLCKSLENKSYSVILEESSQYINLQKGFHRQSSELPPNYSGASRIENLYVISTQQNMCILTST